MNKLKVLKRQHYWNSGLPWWLRDTESACSAGYPGLILGDEGPWGRKWKCTPVFLPEESHGQRNLVGYSPRDHRESGMTEWLTLLLALYGNRQVKVTFISCINFTYHWLFRKVSCVTSDKESPEPGDKIH